MDTDVIHRPPLQPVFGLQTDGGVREEARDNRTEGETTAGMPLKSGRPAETIWRRAGAQRAAREEFWAGTVAMVTAGLKEAQPRCMCAAGGEPGPGGRNAVTVL
ncbi:hypothetical protein EYF80_038470 [Liparis tanakae]|uniref:Uncharacterized protein n=1 Tax=Liparis tanakae TaxID=230148 RepID=A0A4Z2GCK9_9TELE|nr:hypothetical protein EYF80_038470 [Liparis tanakae]